MFSVTPWVSWRGVSKDVVFLSFGGWGRVGRGFGGRKWVRKGGVGEERRSG